MFLFLFLCIRVSDYIYVDDADCDYLTLDIQSRWKNVHCYEKQSTFLIGSIRKLPYFLYFAFSIHVFPIFMKINNILDAVFTFTPYHYRWHSFSLVTKKKSYRQITNAQIPPPHHPELLIYVLAVDRCETNKNSQCIQKKEERKVKNRNENHHNNNVYW